MAGQVSRFNPFRELARMDPFRNMDDLFRDLSVMPALRGMGLEPRMPIDIHETEQTYVVKAEIPGAKKEDIKISIDGNEVSIRVSMAEEQQSQEGGNKVFSERYFGELYRSFTLPESVDETKADARYENGVLNLSLPKKPGAGTRQVAVQ